MKFLTVNSYVIITGKLREKIHRNSPENSQKNSPGNSSEEKRRISYKRSNCAIVSCYDFFTRISLSVNFLAGKVPLPVPAEDLENILSVLNAGSLFVAWHAGLRQTPPGVGAEAGPTDAWPGGGGEGGSPPLVI